MNKIILLSFLMIIASCNQKLNNGIFPNNQIKIPDQTESSLSQGEILVIPDSLNVYATSTGQSVLKYKIKNQSSQKGKINIQGYSTVFKIETTQSSCTNPKTLNPNQECSVVISFNSNVAGSYAINFLVNDGVSGLNLSTIPLLMNNQILLEDLNSPTSNPNTCKNNTHLQGRSCVSNEKIFALAPDNTIIDHSLNYKCFWDSIEKKYQGCILNSCQSPDFVKSGNVCIAQLTSCTPTNSQYYLTAEQSFDPQTNSMGECIISQCDTVNFPNVVLNASLNKCEMPECSIANAAIYQIDPSNVSSVALNNDICEVTSCNPGYVVSNLKKSCDATMIPVTLNKSINAAKINRIQLPLAPVEVCSSNQTSCVDQVAYNDTVTYQSINNDSNEYRIDGWDGLYNNDLTLNVKNPETHTLKSSAKVRLRVKGRGFLYVLNETGLQDASRTCSTTDINVDANASRMYQNNLDISSNKPSSLLNYFEDTKCAFFIEQGQNIEIFRSDLSNHNPIEWGFVADNTNECAKSDLENKNFVQKTNFKIQNPYFPTNNITDEVSNKMSEICKINVNDKKTISARFERPPMLGVAFYDYDDLVTQPSAYINITTLSSEMKKSGSKTKACRIGADQIGGKNIDLASNNTSTYNQPFMSNLMGETVATITTGGLINTGEEYNNCWTFAHTSENVKVEVGGIDYNAYDVEFYLYGRDGLIRKLGAGTDSFSAAGAANRLIKGVNHDQIKSFDDLSVEDFCKFHSASGQPANANKYVCYINLRKILKSGTGATSLYPYDPALGGAYATYTNDPVTNLYNFDYNSTTGSYSKTTTNHTNTVNYELFAKLVPRTGGNQLSTTFQKTIKYKINGLGSIYRVNDSGYVELIATNNTTEPIIVSKDYPVGTKIKLRYAAANNWEPKMEGYYGSNFWDISFNNQAKTAGTNNLQGFPLTFETTPIDQRQNLFSLNNDLEFTLPSDNDNDENFIVSITFSNKSLTKFMISGDGKATIDVRNGKTSVIKESISYNGTTNNGYINKNYYLTNVNDIGTFAIKYDSDSYGSINADDMIFTHNSLNSQQITSSSLNNTDGFIFPFVDNGRIFYGFGIYDQSHLEYLKAQVNYGIKRQTIESMLEVIQAEDSAFFNQYLTNIITPDFTPNIQTWNSSNYDEMFYFRSAPWYPYAESATGNPNQWNLSLYENMDQSRLFNITINKKPKIIGTLKDMNSCYGNGLIKNQTFVTCLNFNKPVNVKCDVGYSAINDLKVKLNNNAYMSYIGQSMDQIGPQIPNVLCFSYTIPENQSSDLNLLATSLETGHCKVTPLDNTSVEALITNEKFQINDQNMLYCQTTDNNIIGVKVDVTAPPMAQNVSYKKGNQVIYEANQLEKTSLANETFTLLDDYNSYNQKQSYFYKIYYKEGLNNTDFCNANELTALDSSKTAESGSIGIFDAYNVVQNIIYMESVIPFVHNQYYSYRVVTSDYSGNYNISECSNKIQYKIRPFVTSGYMMNLNNPTVVPYTGEPAKVCINFSEEVIPDSNSELSIRSYNHTNYILTVGLLENQSFPNSQICYKVDSLPESFIGIIYVHQYDLTKIKKANDPTTTAIINDNVQWNSIGTKTLTESGNFYDPTDPDDPNNPNPGTSSPQYYNFTNRGHIDYIKISNSPNYQNEGFNGSGLKYILNEGDNLYGYVYFTDDVKLNQALSDSKIQVKLCTPQTSGFVQINKNSLNQYLNNLGDKINAHFENELKNCSSYSTKLMNFDKIVSSRIARYQYTISINDIAFNVKYHKFIANSGIESTSNIKFFTWSETYGSIYPINYLIDYGTYAGYSYCKVWDYWGINNENTNSFIINSCDSNNLNVKIGEHDFNTYTYTYNNLPFHTSSLGYIYKVEDNGDLYDASIISNSLKRKGNYLETTDGLYFADYTNSSYIYRKILNSGEYLNFNSNYVLLNDQKTLRAYFQYDYYSQNSSPEKLDIDQFDLSFSSCSYNFNNCINENKNLISSWYSVNSFIMDQGVMSNYVNNNYVIYNNDVDYKCNGSYSYYSNNSLITTDDSDISDCNTYTGVQVGKQVDVNHMRFPEFSPSFRSSHTTIQQCNNCNEYQSSNVNKYYTSGNIGGWNGYPYEQTLYSSYKSMYSYSYNYNNVQIYKYKNETFLTPVMNNVSAMIFEYYIVNNNFYNFYNNRYSFNNSAGSFSKIIKNYTYFDSSNSQNPFTSAILFVDYSNNLKILLEGYHNMSNPIQNLKDVNGNSINSTQFSEQGYKVGSKWIGYPFYSYNGTQVQQDKTIQQPYTTRAYCNKNNIKYGGFYITNTEITSSIDTIDQMSGIYPECKIVSCVAGYHVSGDQFSCIAD